MLFLLLIGFLLGVCTCLFILYVIAFDPFGPPVKPPPFIDQFKPIQIPPELRKFLKSGEDGQGVSKWESTLSLTLFLHMFYQEHKDTRQLRRWFHKRLQLELNDITTRSAAGRLIQDIRIRDLCLGTKFPTINAIRVEKVEMAEDKETFENVTFLIDMDYTGGFETSIDVQTILAGHGSLSIKVTRLAGLVRLILSRKPYNHWTFSFVSAPVFDFDINSQIQGHRLKHVIPLITQQIKRALQRKHVWPNYKIRYRPIFPNPLLQPSAPLNAFAHVKLIGGLEVTVLQCSRLKMSMVDSENVAHDVYCTLTLDQRPFLQSDSSTVVHSISVMLTFARYDADAESGLTFIKDSCSSSVRTVRVSTVDEGSLADKANFKAGDVIIAINNIPIRTERQVERLLSMKGDLLVLVDRDLDDIDDQSLKDGEVLIGDGSSDPDDAFVCIGELDGRRNKLNRPNHLPMDDEDTPVVERSVSPSNSDSQRRHSFSALPVSTSSLPTDSLNESINDQSDSINSSIADLNQITFEHRLPSTVSVQRTESAKVPHLLVSVPSIDLRRTRSESELDVKPVDVLLQELSSNAREEASGPQEEIFQKVHSTSLGRAPVNDCDLMLLEKMDGENGDMDTLKEGASLFPAGSQASLVSSNSILSTQSGISTAHTNNDDEDDDSKMNRSRPQSTRRQRLHVALAAGRKKVFDLIPAKKKTNMTILNTDTVEMGADAGELIDGLVVDSERENSRSPIPNGKRSPTECCVVDKEKIDKQPENKSKSKKLNRKKKGLSPNTPRKTNSGPPATDDSPSGSSTGFIHSRTTRAVHLQQNVLWGQSLHFELENASADSSRAACKYLNLTVHAREATKPGDTQKDKEPKRPVLLGYASLYIPQLIDDCKLTLSNCHREVFHLKPPTGAQTPADPSSSSFSSEFSRHAGFDPRLLFGDVTLGFRYFPDGLPKGAATNAADSSYSDYESDGEDEAVPSEEVPCSSSAFTPPALSPHNHEWRCWASKQVVVCSQCRGKIWMKNGASCARCLVVVHTKCQKNANTGIVCTPSQVVNNDSQFEDILTSEEASSVAQNEETVSQEGVPMVANEETVPTSIIPQMDKDKMPYRIDLETVSRRARLKHKMSEKWSNWRKKGGKDKDDDSFGSHTHEGASSPVASIASCLSDVLLTLEGSPFIADVYFQPGNAYNEETIRNAKNLGREIFKELPPVERKVKVDEQIDKIQRAIRETKDGRLVAKERERRESESGAEKVEKSEESESFEGLDERLQALAVLMLHYCAALQDCSEKIDEFEESNADVEDEKEKEEEPQQPSDDPFDDSQVEKGLSDSQPF